MKPIELVEQDGPTDCQCACLAMLTGLPLEKLVDRHSDNLYGGRVRFDEVALQYGVILKTPTSLEEAYEGNVYALIVPSGTRTTFHMVLADTREGTVIYDPSHYFKQSVTPDPLSNDVQLTSFVVRYEVVMCPHLGIY